MILVVGLGNPGEEFKNTRHNIGREICGALLKKEGWSDFIFSKKFNAQISEGKLGKEKVVAICPNTFMNKSGQAVSAIAKFYKIKPDKIFVIQDDSDLPLGSTKLSFSKRSAGHKGVESIIRSLKTLDFWRFRIGAGGKKHVDAEKIILKKFTPAEIATLKKVIKKTIGAIELAITESPEKAMNEYNKQ